MYRVREENLPGLVERVEKLQKRAAKLDMDPIQMEIGEPEEVRWEERGIERVRLVYPVELEGGMPVLDGWEFWATLDRTDGGVMLRSKPGIDLPEEYRDEKEAMLCDHCETRRYRNVTYVIAHPETERVMKVGSTCIRDFLPGGRDAERWAELAAMVRDLFVSAPGLEEEDYWGSGVAAPTRWGMETFLSVVAALIRKDGWLSRSKASQRFGDGAEEGTATADDAVYYLVQPWDARSRREWERWRADRPVTEQDKEQARLALEWARGAGDGSDYWHNIGVALACDYVDPKSAGIVASIVSGYQREQRRLAERERRAGNSLWLGEVGDRVEWNVECEASIFLGAGTYGDRYLIKFREQDTGGMIVWFTSRGWEEGWSGTIRATIKDLSEFKGVKQTVVSRATEVNDD